MATPVEHSSRKILLTLKEGFLYKKGGIIKSWARRYFILTHQSLCYFRREREDLEGLEPLGRIFLSDIVKIDTEGIEKKKAFVFALHTKKRAVLLQAANHEDRDKWVEVIRRTLETDKEAERKDPFRKTLRKLAPGTPSSYDQMFDSSITECKVCLRLPSSLYGSKECVVYVSLPHSMVARSAWFTSPFLTLW